jgi:hypothetical protein
MEVTSTNCVWHLYDDKYEHSNDASVYKVVSNKCNLIWFMLLGIKQRET